MTILASTNDKAFRLFDDILKETPVPLSQTCLLVVSHILPNTPPFIRALAKHFELIGIIPKPKSIHYPTLENLRENGRYPFFHLSRIRLQSATNVSTIINPLLDGRNLIILDIGGYFANCINDLHSQINGRIIGIVEDTENGHQKYSAISNYECPIISVARSPLKNPEDFLVGQSVVFSAERVLRENNILLINKKVLIIGYGKIGRSIAASLSARNVEVSIYDSDPIKMAQARFRFTHST